MRQVAISSMTRVSSLAATARVMVDHRLRVHSDRQTTNISLMAHYTAQAWVRQRLPWAWRFDTWRGRVFYDLARPLFRLAGSLGHTTAPDFLVQRHRIIDALVEALAPAQVVELASGLSPRCLALSHKRGVPCIDVDLPQMVQLKAALVGADAPTTYQQAELDLAGSRDYAADLGRALRPIAPTVVITEGILPYFPLSLQQHVFGQIAALLRACGGGVYLTDIHHQDAVDRLALGRAFRVGLHLVARSPRHPMIANQRQAEQMLGRAGFERVVAHHPLQWQRALALPVRPRGSGLRVYQATLVSPGQQGL